MNLVGQAGRGAPVGTDAYFAEISRHFASGGDRFSFEWLLIGLGLTLLVVAAASLRTWWKTRHLRPAPLQVFNEVAGACGLSLGERLLLWRIARQQALPTPLTLLLSPTTLRHHARAYADTRGSAGRAALMRRIAGLRRRIFADTAAPGLPDAQAGGAGEAVVRRGGDA